MREDRKGDEAVKTPQDKGVVLQRLVMPKCITCDYWMKDDIPEDSMPYCPELKYFTSILEQARVPADFGCIRHSSIN